MLRVGIVGATGYGGRELLRVLFGHPAVRLTALASTSVSGRSLSEVLPAFAGMSNLVFAPFDADALREQCDVVFVGVPGGESMEPVAALRAAGIRTIDIGPDFRLKDAGVFRTYYGREHTAPHLLPDAVYGLPAFYRDAIRCAGLVAVPGCYPITVLAPLRPLLERVEVTCPVVVDAISGVSGAGRTPNEVYHFPEMNENLRAYKLAVHQHTPEIEQEIGHRALVQFTPHVAPLTRGILSTITVRPARSVDLADVYAEYASEPFIRVLGSGRLAEVRHVRASNYCDFGWAKDERTGNLLVVSAIDNLMGGTAGMAVQCMNLMFGIDETTGLWFGGMAP